MIVDILGRRWKVKVMSADNFKRLYEEDVAAYTIPDSSELIFVEEELCLPTIIHEFVHAAFDSLCVSSAELTVHQIEEVFAEMLAVHGEMLIKKAKKLFKEIKD